MEKNRKVQKFKERGITLIALVITIIVLLILAGVTLSTLTGDSGILSNAEKAKDKTDQATLKEEVSLKVIEDELDTQNQLTIEDRLNKIENAKVEKIREDTFYVTRNKATYTVYETGELIEGKAVWDGETIESPEFKESESKVFNWYIYTPAQLKFLADYVNQGRTVETLTTEQRNLLIEAGYNPEDVTMTEDTIVYLMNDLDLGAREVNGEWENQIIRQDGDEVEKNENFTWTPIGNTKANTLIATFEGNGKTIKGVYINADTNFNGIFGNAYSIKNLTIENSYIKGGICTAGIVGALRSGTVENCHNINTTVILIEGEYVNVGGVVGQISSNISGKVLNCSNTGTIIARGIYSSGATTAGGVVGLAGIGSTVNNCYNEGTVESSGGNNTGGVVGAADPYTTISECYNTGSVTGMGYQIGGIVGVLASEDGIVTNSKVEKCYNSGSVSCSGGIVGGIVGALKGSSGQGTVIQCYSKGEVTGTTGVGAVIGLQVNTTGLNTLKNLYYLDTVAIGGIRAISNQEDDEENKIMSTTENITSYKQFLEWIQGKSQM